MIAHRAVVSEGFPLYTDKIKQCCAGSSTSSAAPPIPERVNQSTSMTGLTNQISPATSLANQNSPSASSAQQTGNPTKLTNQHTPTKFNPSEDNAGYGDGNSATPQEKHSPKER